MHRIFWFKVGGTRLHLLKLAGALFLAGALLKTFEAAYSLFVTASKAAYVQAVSSGNSEAIIEHFGWSIVPFSFSTQDLVGVMMGPLANFVFWLGLATVALMVYQSGKFFFPVEEYEQKIAEHHEKLIRKAVEHHKTLRKK